MFIAINQCQNVFRPTKSSLLGYLRRSFYANLDWANQKNNFYGTPISIGINCKGEKLYVDFITQDKPGTAHRQRHPGQGTTSN
jgi:hypothetical protein